MMRYVILLSWILLFAIVPVVDAQRADDESVQDCLPMTVETTPEPESTPEPTVEVLCEDIIDIIPGTWVLEYSQFAGCSLPSGIAGELSGFEIEIENNVALDFVNTALGNSKDDEGVYEGEGEEQATLIVDRSSERVLIATQSLPGTMLEMIFFIEDESRVTFSGIIDSGFCSINVEGRLSHVADDNANGTD